MDKQIQKYSKVRCNPKLLKTLDLAKSIISGKKSISVLEMELKITHTLNLPTLRSTFKGEDMQIGFSVVKVLVKRFMESFGFSSKPSEDMIEMISVDTLDKFSHETFPDIIIFFKMARTGFFGNTDRGVDSNLIFGKWYPMYLEKKSKMREDNYLAEKNKRNENLFSIEQVKNQYNINQNKSKKLQYRDKVIARIDEITENYDRHLLEDLIFDWERDEAKRPYIKFLKMKRKTIKYEKI